MTSVLTKGGNLDTDIRTGRTPCEDKGRDQVTRLQAYECHIFLVNHQKLRDGHEEILLQTF